MKVKVSDKVVGSIAIPALNNAFRGGTEVIMTEDQFWAESTQWALENGYLIALEAVEPRVRKESGATLRSKNPHPLTINILNRSINFNEVFFVSNEQLRDRQIADAISLGLFVRESKTEVTKSASGAVVSSKKIARKTDDVEEKPSVAPKIKQTAKVAKKADNSNIKTVLGKLAGSSDEPPQSVSLPEIKNTRKTQAYVHRPDGARINEPPKTVKPRDNPLILDLESNNEEVE